MHNSIRRNMVRALGIAGLTVLGLQGCATENAREGMAFPDPGDAWVEGGTYANLDNLRKMRVGASKDQVRDLLGSPHFSEGLIGVHEWNYVFHLPQGDGSYRVCQYQVKFDNDMLAEGLHWRDGECAALLEPPSPEAPPEPQRMTLAADTLFDFDSSELTHEGRQEVVALAERIREAFASPDIVVTGYTDRIGSEAYNLTLSEQRAASVRRALISQNVSPSAVRSMGLGEGHPVVDCPASRVTPQVKACLRPNRRVEVEVTER
ncbi:OmpA family protein [Halomonas sp. THAF12]|uniref:OmpA family protein n=1 Tax=Halomonas sp. B23F22_10 TaxID=3459515 RepID=UPI00373E4E32